MNSQTNLFHISTFDFKLKHLLIIGILILSFSISYLIRAQPADFGFELMEFDPYFNYRATEYIVENGFLEYFEWNDDKTWYPDGRNVSATSQVMLHLTAATIFPIFQNSMSLYDFTIFFPAVIGALTTIVMFGLVRLFAGTNAGLIASLLFAISFPIVLRGSIGWFKSEPLGLFYGLIGLYLFLSGIKSKNKKVVILKIIFGGIILAFGLASWGGDQFFIIPIGLFIFSLPFIRKDHNFLLWSVPLFVISFFLTLNLFERPGLTFIASIGGVSLIIPTLFLISSVFIQKISKNQNKIRNNAIFLIAIILIGTFIMIINIELDFLPLSPFRYLNAINPFMTTVDPLVDSVAEHLTTNLEMSFYLHSSFMIFAGIGVWLILTRNYSKTYNLLTNDMKSFVLILGLVGLYVSTVFLRLEVFASISLVILASIGIFLLSKEIFEMKLSNKKNYLFKVPYALIIIIIFTIPLTIPESNWVTGADYPPTLMTGGTAYLSQDDWKETLTWIKNNTPENSVVLSWWDYGYWISTIAERATLIDNATLSTEKIKNAARIFLDSPETSWNMLRQMNVDYLVVYVVAEKLDGTSTEGNSIYILNGGGDELKKQWFMKIAGLPLEDYLHFDGISGTGKFWNETLLGKLIPFSPYVYYDQETQSSSLYYNPTSIEITVKEIKYDFDSDGPFKLVHTSPSFTNDYTGMIHSVLVYEVNKNFSNSVSENNN